MLTFWSPHPHTISTHVGCESGCKPLPTPTINPCVPGVPAAFPASSPGNTRRSGRCGWTKTRPPPSQCTSSYLY